MRPDSQRNLALDALDYYPTPGWATRALFEYCPVTISGAIWEPASGGGHMVRVLEERGLHVISTDIQHDGLSFLTRPPIDCDWIITNPPFNQSLDFALTAIKHAKVGVALFVRYAFLESQARYSRLFKYFPPQLISQFVERVALVEGRTDKSVGSAIPYVWLIWDKTKPEYPTVFTWIPPCKLQLSRDADWDVK